MKTISFYNRKGGVGKTILSFMFARFLSTTGKKVLFLDLDPQRTATNHFARIEDIDRKEYLEKNCFDVLRNVKNIKDSLIQAGEVSLLAGNYDLSELMFDQQRIKDILTECENDFDYCIIDNAPNYTLIHQSMIHASDIIIIPTLADHENLEQTAWTSNRVTKVKPDIEKRILLNQYNLEKPVKKEKEYLEQFLPLFENIVLPVSIPEKKDIVRSYSARNEKVTTAKSKQLFLNNFTQFVNTVTNNNFQVEAF